MLRLLFDWLDVPFTSSGCCAAIGLVVGSGCAFLAVMAAVHGYWWRALMFAVCTPTPLLMVWRYARGRDCMTGSARDPDRK
jgi:hypothetical protein